MHSSFGVIRYLTVSKIKNFECHQRSIKLNDFKREDWKNIETPIIPLRCLHNTMHCPRNTMHYPHKTGALSPFNTDALLPYYRSF